MKAHKSYTCPIVEDEDGQLCIEFNDEIMEALDLQVGDVLQWEPHVNGSWILNKKVGEKNEEG